MTLGTKDEHRGRITKAESFSFDRKMFKWSYNGHTVVLINNDGYVADDGRIFIHIDLSCLSCGRNSIIRGKIDQDNHTIDRLQTIKMVALYPYHAHDC